MKNILLSITSLISLYVLALLFFNYYEQPSSRFSNYDELAASGLIERGWVPEYLPKSITNIEEQHDLDTNWVRMSFSYNPDKTNITDDDCNLLVGNVMGKKYICKPFEGVTALLILMNNGKGYYKSDYERL